MTDKEPKRYWDWMLWKNRQEDAKMNEKRFDEYGNYGENNPPVGVVPRKEGAKSIDDATPEEWDALRHRANKNLMRGESGLSLDPSGNELYRRELITATNLFETVKLDMQRLTEDYYKLINRVKELSEENDNLKRQMSELRKILD